MANRGHEPKQKQPPRSGKHLFLLKKMGFQAAWYGCKNSMASQTPPLTYPSSRAYWVWVSFGNALLLEAYLWGGTLGGRLTSHDKSLLLNRKSLLLRIEILMWWIWGCPNILGGVKVLGPKAKRMLLNAKKMGDINFNFLIRKEKSAPPTALPGAEMTRLAFKRPLACATSAACMIEAFCFLTGLVDRPLQGWCVAWGCPNGAKYLLGLARLSWVPPLLKSFLFFLWVLKIMVRNDCEIAAPFCEMVRVVGSEENPMIKILFQSIPESCHHESSNIFLQNCANCRKREDPWSRFFP